ncbi:MAG: DMT family transporter, partial [Flavobacteriaceae bacterium]|nr:DMT family transporter [Flavobacteriaceae bacterium]
MNNKQLRWLILIVLAIVWGSSFILMKKALIDLTPIQAGALRIIFTAITLLIAGFNTIFSITKKEWYYIFLTAVLGTFFPAFLFAYAIQNIDSSIASILNSLTPLNTLIVGAMFYGFTFLRKQFIGIIIGLIGSVFLILKGAEVNPDQNYFYSIFIVLASIGYAFNVNILKKHLNNLNALTITTGNFVILIIPALIILWFSDFFEVNYIYKAKSSLIYLIVLAIFGTALAKTLFNRLV